MNDMWSRSLPAILVATAAVACPVICTDGPGAGHATQAPSSPDDHGGACGNACFCSVGSTLQSPWRVAFEYAPDVANFVATTPTVPGLLMPADTLLAAAARLRAGPFPDQPLPLLI